MRFTFRSILAGLAIAAMTAGLATAGNTILFSSKTGDVTFPISPPPGTGGPGAIDNMAIGATTPSTGAFTSLTVNGNAGTTCASYYFTGTPAATDQVFFLATRPFLIISISEVHAVAAGGASKLQVTKDTSTNAPGAGTDLLTNNTNTGFDLAATANTPQVGTLVAAAATKTLAAGDRLAVDFADAIQSSAGVVVTACMQPI